MGPGPAQAPEPMCSGCHDEIVLRHGTEFLMADSEVGSESARRVGDPNAGRAGGAGVGGAGARGSDLGDGARGGHFGGGGGGGGGSTESDPGAPGQGIPEMQGAECREGLGGASEWGRATAGRSANSAVPSGLEHDRDAPPAPRTAAETETDGESGSGFDAESDTSSSGSYVVDEAAFMVEPDGGPVLGAQPDGDGGGGGTDRTVGEMTFIIQDASSFDPGLYNATATDDDDLPHRLLYFHPPDVPRQRALFLVGAVDASLNFGARMAHSGGDSHRHGASDGAGDVVWATAPPGGDGEEREVAADPPAAPAPGRCTASAPSHPPAPHTPSGPVLLRLEAVVLCAARVNDAWVGVSAPAAVPDAHMTLHVASLLDTVAFFFGPQCLSLRAFPAPARLCAHAARVGAVLTAATCDRLRACNPFRTVARVLCHLPHRAALPEVTSCLQAFEADRAGERVEGVGSGGDRGGGSDAGDEGWMATALFFDRYLVASDVAAPALLQAVACALPFHPCHAAATAPPDQHAAGATTGASPGPGSADPPPPVVCLHSTTERTEFRRVWVPTRAMRGLRGGDGAWACDVGRGLGGHEERGGGTRRDGGAEGLEGRGGGGAGAGAPPHVPMGLYTFSTSLMSVTGLTFDARLNPARAQWLWARTAHLSRLEQALRAESQAQSPVRVSEPSAAPAFSARLGALWRDVTGRRTHGSGASPGAVRCSALRVDDRLGTVQCTSAADPASVAHARFGYGCIAAGASGRVIARRAAGPTLWVRRVRSICTILQVWGGGSEGVPGGEAEHWGSGSAGGDGGDGDEDPAALEAVERAVAVAVQCIFGELAL